MNDFTMCIKIKAKRRATQAELIAATAAIIEMANDMSISPVTQATVNGAGKFYIFTMWTADGEMRMFPFTDPGILNICYSQSWACYRGV